MPASNGKETRFVSMKVERPAMRFGFMLFPYDRYRHPQEIIDVVRAAEELGYYATELAEHLLPPKPAEELLNNKIWYDNYVLGAYIASATQRINLLLHAVFPYHNPFRLAKTLATMDAIYGSRVICNVAAGWMKEEFQQLGVPFDQRGAIADEYIRVIRELWTDDAPSFSGSYATFSNVSFFPKPYREARIPLLIGGTGRRPCRRAAELGDGWHPMRGSLEQVREGIEWIRTHARFLGRDVGDFHFGFNALAVDADETIETARGHAGDRRLRARRRTPSELIEQVHRFQEIGVNYLTVSFAWRAVADLIRELDQFAQGVMPEFI